MDHTCKMDVSSKGRVVLSLVGNAQAGNASQILINKEDVSPSSANGEDQYRIKSSKKYVTKKRKIIRRYRRSTADASVATPHSILRMTRRFSQKLKSVPGNISSLSFRDLAQTWSHYIEEYGKMDRDLSVVERPLCFNGYGFMSAPQAFNENKRTAVAKLYMGQSKWRHKNYFEALLTPILQKYNVSGVSVSLLDRTRQNIKFSIGLTMAVISRSVSLDGHAILSSAPMVILDASCDWRMMFNPLVHGPPFVRFYVGCQLRDADTNLPIGVLTLFDPYARPYIPQKMLSDLQEVAKCIMQFVELKPPSSARIESCSATSADDSSVGVDRSLWKHINIMETKNLDEVDRDRAVAMAHDIMLPHECTVRYNADSLRELSCSPTLLKSYEISRELMECGDAKHVTAKACQILAQTLGLDFVYLLEMKVTVIHRVPKHRLSFSSGVVSTSVPGIDNILGPERDKHVRMRLFGGYGLQEGREYQFDPDVHLLALNSPFGVQYNSPEKSVKYEAGIFMPFQKSDREIVYSFKRPVHCRRTPRSIQEPSPEMNALGSREDSDEINVEQDLAGEFEHKVSLDQEDNEDIVITVDMTKRQSKLAKETSSVIVKAKYGGFVIAGFSSASRSFSPGDVEYMKLCIKALDNIFSCS